MKIQRVDVYDDNRFNKQILKQHGAYLIDRKYPCEFLITGKDSAIIYYNDYSYIDKIIEEFRFYSRHICKFYSKNNRLIRQFNDVNVYKCDINKLQPSQFYIDEEKLYNVSCWAKSEENFVVPILKSKSDNIVLDGHTRLYLAKKLNIKQVYVYEDSSDEHIYNFVNEAKRRNIYNIGDLELVCHNDYFKKWYNYCDEYFRNVSTT
ncbi:hypothetical protein JYG23_05525 [Sedimentibacter sp. zth1]|uniref:hypothetical protein n=1 Tax=Sedimentibacter sp. zth1 TaxID=2816908 RepID=UPI001A9366AD|nr:hypothetical protein [Sedimentibacter sp. zth1]QSX06906.1 hypothetical protein JYG23_05525 [Sedimentibacter sp. zth1]